jgi:hypothetical protein
MTGLHLALLLLPHSGAPLAGNRTHGFFQPLRHGVVFWQEKTPEQAVAELEKVKAQGFNLIAQSSWVWTLPKPGSDLERVMQAELKWCDENDLRFFLLHGIQYGSPGEGGNLDDAWEDPRRAAPLLDDWVRVLHGHPCVEGVILGNEVSPVAGNSKDNPKWWAGFTEAMRRRHATIEALNRSWGARFESWEKLGPPPGGSIGRVDLERFATEAFNRFYGTLFEKVLRPALGPLEYGTKSAGDPILQRRLTQFSVIGWDDVLANYPQWRIKAMCDLGRRLDRPMFNSELHLYNDDYVYNQSVPMSRYRYFTSALNGETTTAGFAWNMWKKPETIEVHSHTAAILAELRRLEPQLRKFAAQPAELHVLLTPAYVEGDDTDPERKPLAEQLYAQMAMLGTPWEFVCEEDVSTIASGTLVIPEQPRLEPATAQAVTGLPKRVRVICLNEPPTQDEYGRMLPQNLRLALATRGKVVDSEGGLATPVADPGRPYNEPTQTEYLWWSERKGHFRAPMTYPLLEARRVREGAGWLVAVINHATAGEPVEAQLPWLRQLSPAKVVELTGKGGEVPAGVALVLEPLAVRVFRYE